MMTIEKQELVEFGSIHPSSINDTNNQLKISTADSKIKYPAFNLHEWCVENYLKYERLPYHSKNDKRLYSALKLFDNLHLLKTTLLDKVAHKRHSINLYKRLLRKFRKTLIPNESSSKRISRMGLSPSGYFESKEHRMARDLIRLVTVVHSIEALDVDAALLKAKELIAQIQEYVSKMPGAAFFGTIEFEVISINLMRRIRVFYDEQAKKHTIDEDGVITYCDGGDGFNLKEYRKFNNCEKLGSHLDESDINGESGQFLLHCHGVLKVDNPQDIDKLYKIFLENPNWNRASRQVQFKTFNKTWDKIHKPLETSLNHIIRYITKGGIVLKKDGGYLQYNLDCPKGLSMSYNEYLFYSDRSNDDKRQAKINKFEVLDLPILSNHEINSLALVIDGLMNFNKSRTGYLVTVGRW